MSTVADYCREQDQFKITIVVQMPDYEEPIEISEYFDGDVIRLAAAGNGTDHLARTLCGMFLNIRKGFINHLLQKGTP